MGDRSIMASGLVDLIIFVLLLSVVLVPFSLGKKANRDSDKTSETNDFAEFETEEDDEGDEPFEPNVQVEQHEDKEDDDEDVVETGRVNNYPGCRIAWNLFRFPLLSYLQ